MTNNAEENLITKIFRRIAYILRVFYHYHLFQILPAKHDKLKGNHFFSLNKTLVHMKIVSKFLKGQKKFTVRKRELSAFVNEYIQEHNWQPRPQYILVDPNYV